MVVITSISVSATGPYAGHALIAGSTYPNATVTIEVSSSLSGFNTLGTVTADSNGEFNCDDFTAVEATGRFYKASVE